MKTVAVAGAGLIGSTIAQRLAACGDYRIVTFDPGAADKGRGPGAANERRRVAIEAPDALGGLDDLFAVVNAAPFFKTVEIAETALRAGAHYFDLTEDVASTRRVREIAARSPRAFAPQCGLAPGFISIVGGELARRFEKLDSLRLRVGALPRFPLNALGYALTWSPEGLINEYCEPCEAVVEGARCEVRPLEGLERFSLDGVEYEAFNTSGGLGGLCEALAGRAREVNYRTIRYPGHAAAMRLLLGDLRLRERRDLLKSILQAALPATRQDVVVILAAAAGWRDGRFVEETYVQRIFGDEGASAIQTATAAGLCAVLDLVATGRLPQSGLVAQEEISLEVFLANRFGAVYAPRDLGARIAAE